MKAAVVLLFLALYGVAAENEPGRLNRMPKGNQLFGIKGGTEISIEKRPYNVAILKTPGEFIGGGVLINKQWVLSAAVNVVANSNFHYQVRLGSRNVSSGGITVDVVEMFIYPGYAGNWEYDLALLKLSKPIKTTPRIKPISLAKTLPKRGANTVVTGYGGTRYRLETDGILREAVVPFIPYKTCKKNYESESHFTKRNFCASKAGVGPCPYDWGSPLVYKNKLIGIFSGSYADCGSVDAPAVYADLTKYMKWIEDIINEY